jgi:hypothetical protein
VARGEDQDDPSRGGAGNGSDEPQGDAEWLLRQLGAGGPGEEDAGPGSAREANPPREPKPAKEPREPKAPDAPKESKQPGAPKGPKPARAPEQRTTAAAAVPVGGADAPPGGMDRRRKVLLLLIALGLAAVLALAALFFLGVRLGAGGSSTQATPTPTPTASPSPSETPSPTPAPTEEPAAAGPVAPGTHAWDDLRGGECLAPYASPWEEEYSVVDCAEPHPAQLVYRGGFPTDTPAFPGEQAILPQLSLLCSAPTVIDVSAAAPYGDLQVQGAYPVTAEQWEAGQRDIFCFVSRSTGEPLTGSIAMPQAAPAG